MLALLLGVLIVMPLAMLVAGAFRTAPPGLPGTWSVDAIVRVLHHPATAQALSNSVMLALVATTISLVLATALVVLVERTDAPFAGLITPAMVCVFTVPGLFFAVAYDLAANRYNGLLNAVITGLSGAPPLLDVESWAGILLVVTLRTTALVYLFLIGPVRAMGAEPEEAARMSGAGTLAVFFTVTLPLLAPATTGAAILALIAVFQTFDEALVLGEPVGLRFASTHIFRLLTGSTPPDYASASLLSLVLIAVAGLLCLIQRRLMRGGHVTVGGKKRSAPQIRLRHLRWPTGLAFLVIFALAFVVPALSLAFASLQPFPGVYGELSLRHYWNIWERPEIWSAARTTLALTVTVGAAAMVTALLTALTVRRMPPLGKGLVGFVVLIPFCMPGLVAALAVSWAYMSLPGLKQLYGTVWLMMLAFVVICLPFTMQCAQAALAQIGLELEEAARIGGASPPRAVFDVLLPLIAPSFIVGWFAAATVIAGSLDIPLLLGAPGLSTLALEVFHLKQSVQLGDAAALMILLMAVFTAPVAAFKFGSRLASLARRDSVS